ncbi:MAG TPA: glycosyltransferase [Solirubrobacteraceae bacterium]|nr:glycosyltransferase [Solirubrobacteraceae bacterium]
MRADLVVLAHSAPAVDRGRLLLGGFLGADVIACGRGRRGVATAIRETLQKRPRVTYLVDVGASTTVAAATAKLVGSRVVLDTGDLVFALERSRGSRSWLGLVVVGAGEKFAVGCADHVVVRGRRHREFLPGKETSFIPDLPPLSARVCDGGSIRRRLGLEHRFVVGLVGSMLAAPRLGISYGWDLVEALTMTPKDVCALFVGDGPARPSLQRRAEDLGVIDRCRFVGGVQADEVADWVGAMDVAVSTQTANAVGVVRTTGKLPLYLACGCPVLASDVGEASHLLADLGWTLPYEGVVDRGYPSRLAEAIASWPRDLVTMRERREQALAVARTAFDVGAAQESARRVIQEILRRSGD